MTPSGSPGDRCPAFGQIRCFLSFVINGRTAPQRSQTKRSLAGSVIQAMPLKGKGSTAAGEAHDD